MIVKKLLPLISVLLLFITGCHPVDNHIIGNPDFEPSFIYVEISN
jgi:hypothetical protein